MKTKIITVLMGIALTLAAAEGVVRVIGDGLPTGTRWPSVETDVKFHQLSELTEADVVFLGSSITEAAIDPVALVEESGIDSAFNSGIPFSTPFSNEWWLDHVVLSSLQPELVVIGLTPWSGGVGISGDPLLRGLRSAPSTEPSHWSALVERAGLLSEWDTRSTEDRTRDLITNLGHQTGYYDRSIDDARPLDLPFGPSVMPQDEADAVRRMIERLAVEDIETMVLIEPGRYPGDDGSFDYDHYIESIRAHEKEWGVPVVDTFHMDWERDLFADLAHFNRRGTEEFTSFVARTVDGFMLGKILQPGETAADIA